MIKTKLAVYYQNHEMGKFKAISVRLFLQLKNLQSKTSSKTPFATEFRFFQSRSTRDQ